MAHGMDLQQQPISAASEVGKLRQQDFEQFHKRQSEPSSGNNFEGGTEMFQLSIAERTFEGCNFPRLRRNELSQKSHQPAILHRLLANGDSTRTHDPKQL